MKIIKYLILLFLVVNLNAYENYVNINQFDRNIQTQIENDLKQLDNVLVDSVLKSFYDKDGIYYKEYRKCIKDNGINVLNLVVKLLQTRLYLVKCDKLNRKNFFKLLDCNYINKQIKKIEKGHIRVIIKADDEDTTIIHTGLVYKYNQYIAEKCKLLGVNPNQYYIKSLNYTIDTVGFRKEWNERIVEIETLWDEVILESLKYDKSWGWFDFMVIDSINQISGEEPNQVKHFQNLQKLKKEINIQTKLLLDNLTEAIKDKFREDVESGLESIYE